MFTPEKKVGFKNVINSDSTLLSKILINSMFSLIPDGGVIVFNIPDPCMKDEFHPDNIEKKLQNFVVDGVCAKWDVTRAIYRDFPKEECNIYRMILV